MIAVCEYSPIQAVITLLDNVKESVNTRNIYNFEKLIPSLLSLIHVILQKMFVSRTPSYVWLVCMLTVYIGMLQ